MKADTLTASTTDMVDTRTGQPSWTETSSDAPMPSKTPSTPPSRLKIMASIRNCSRTSRSMRADGEADADLAGAFGHRHQHDVHDADPADEQAHSAATAPSKPVITDVALAMASASSI
jgi:hypothetical protein